MAHTEYTKEMQEQELNEVINEFVDDNDITRVKMLGGFCFAYEQGCITTRNGLCDCCKYAAEFANDFTAFRTSKERAKRCPGSHPDSSINPMYANPNIIQVHGKKVDVTTL